MPVPSHLVLDLDDTILDYSAPAEALWPQLYRRFAPAMGVPVDRLQRAVKESLRWYWSDPERFREGRLDLKRARRILVRNAFEALGRKDMETADALADAFSRERENVVKPFAGAVESLELFQRRGARMVLLTNGESALQRAKIERFGLGRFFDAILIEGEIGIGKPDPRAHRAALALLEAEPAKAWMIGDSWDFDIRPANALGMNGAWIRDPERASEKPAGVTVPSLRALANRWEDPA
jgi:FMN phosphatase YigB (HAD superfamily)